MAVHGKAKNAIEWPEILGQPALAPEGALLRVSGVE
jgi:hypothetical protein